VFTIRPSAAVFGVCAFAMVGGILMLRSSKETTSASTISSVTAASPRQEDSELINLRQRVESLEFARSVNARSMGVADNSSPDGGSSPALKTYDASTTRAILGPDVIGALVDGEGRDPQWSAGYERDVRSAFAKNFSTSSVREAKCATSVCRIEVEHPSATDQGTFLTQFLNVLPEGFRGVHFTKGTDSNGNPVTTLLLIRKGYEDAVTE
jgi:hypothetical protein